MATRQYDFVTNIETSTAPDAGTPSADSDLITLDYLLASSGTIASPITNDGTSTVAYTESATLTIIIESASGAVEMSSNPQIAVGTRIGQRITLIGNDSTNTIKFVDGNGLRLNGYCRLRDGDTLELQWDGVQWTELQRSQKS